MSSASPINDPLAFGRQLWQQWNDAIQSAVPAALPQAPDWSAAMRNWSELAGGGAPDASRAADKLGVHGRQFFTLMQDLIQRATAGAAATPDLSAMWRSQVGDGNPMLDALRTVSAEGARGWEQLFEATRSAAAPAMTDAMSNLQLPGFGLGRERQAQVGELIAAQAAQLEATQRYQQLLAKAGEAGMERFESKLAEHSEPGRQIGSMRALYDLWIDAAEEAYAEIALSPAFREAYGALVNTQMRAKQLQQREVSRVASELGLPIRSELDGVLGRIHQLQREVRELRRALATKSASATAAGNVEKPVVSGKAAQAPSKTSAGRKRPAAAPASGAKNAASDRSGSKSAARSASSVATRSTPTKAKGSKPSTPVRRTSVGQKKSAGPVTAALFPAEAPVSSAGRRAAPARKKSAPAGKTTTARRG